MSDNPQALFDALGGPLPGFLFLDHVAIAVPRGTLDEQVAAYRLLGFEEVHREESRGRDGVREVMLRIGPGPNMIQLLEPLDEGSTVQKAITEPVAAGLMLIRPHGLNGGASGLNS